jgi:UPF0755 protein
MPLQSDPTVIYGIREFNGNLTKADLQNPTAYNTYLIEGLPPTPICSPGSQAIEAALEPADTDFLFFVSRGDGSSQFSAEYNDHRGAVRKFQIEPAKAEKLSEKPLEKPLEKTAEKFPTKVSDSDLEAILGDVK